METNKQNGFNDQMRERTFIMATNIYFLFQGKKISTISRSIVNQIIRSSSSVAANYRAATRGRSDAEYYSKICIVVEECDETQFWLEFLIRVNEVNKIECEPLFQEVIELLKIFTSTKKKLHERLKPTTMKI